MTGLCEVWSERRDTQWRVLDFIRIWCTLMPYPPTVREIGRGLDISSAGQIYYHLRRLGERGVLQRHHRGSRSWVPA